MYVEKQIRETVSFPSDEYEVTEARLCDGILIDFRVNRRGSIPTVQITDEPMARHVHKCLGELLEYLDEKKPDPSPRHEDEE